MLTFSTGNKAVATAVKDAKTVVVAAYPITPQTEVVEETANNVASGELKARYIPVESEHSSMGACIPKVVFPDRNDVAGETEKPVIIKYADFNELDRNRHVNNSRYTAWAYDALFKCGYDVTMIEDLVINYNSEVKAGEKVELFISKNEDKVTVFGYKNIDTKVFAVEITMRNA